MNRPLDDAPDDVVFTAAMIARGRVADARARRAIVFMHSPTMKAILSMPNIEQFVNFDALADVIARYTMPPDSPGIVKPPEPKKGK